MKSSITLKNNLKDFRNKKGLTQEELAFSCGTSRQTIVAIEKEQFNPSAKLALLVCISLDCKFEELFYIE